MPTFFVRKTGNDASAGTTPSTAWLTIGKALGAAGMASGDTCYVGAGTYRELVAIAMTSPTAETKLIADVDGAQTGDAGRVIWTARTTNDTTVPANANGTLDLAARDFLTIEGFYMEGSGNAFTVYAGTTNSTNITLRRCVLMPGNASGTALSIGGSAGVANSWLIENCVLVSGENGSCFSITLPTHTADYDAAVLFRNCIFFGSFSANSAILINTSGATAGKGGGVGLVNCLVVGCSIGMKTFTANVSTTIPCYVYNSVFAHCNNPLNANTLGQIVEDYCIMAGTTARTNVTAGANSQTGYTYFKGFDFFYSLINGFQPCGFFFPLASSKLLGFGASGTPAAVTTDIVGRPRPAGGQSTANAIGPIEAHDTAAKETGTTDAGGVGLSITGPGDQDLQIPVNATATTITIRARYDTAHTATTKPQVQLQANGEIGVLLQTVTMTVAADTWETLTVGPFTPTAKGWVTLRLLSRPTGATGKAFFDSLVVS